MFHESNVVELKSKLIDEVKNEIIAFLNTKGGKIYVGVNDDGTINESFLEENRDALSLKLASWLQEAFYPLPSNLVTFDFDEDGVLEIDVEEGNNKPYYLREKGPKPSGVYKRVGTSIRKCSEDEILKMIMDSKAYDYESDISDNQDLTFRFLSKFCDEHEIDFGDKQMVTLGLRRANGAYTNLGLLLSDESPVCVKVAEYDGQMNFKLKKTFEGSLLKALLDTQEQAERMNDVSAVIDRVSWKRIETPSYPGNSLREIILNAFCHTNYFIRSNIKVEFYKDKAKITSPGGLYKTTLEDVLKGVQTYRNERLVHLLDKLGLIENYGTGIARTLNAYKGTGREPEFYDSKNFFIVYLPNLNYRDQINDQINDQITELGLSILRTVSGNPGIKADRIHEILSSEDKAITLNMVRNSIKRELRNYIELRGSRKTGGYYLKEIPHKPGE